MDNGPNYNMTGERLALEHLTVEVKCEVVVERISRILEFLHHSGIPSENIKILPAPKLIKLDNKGPWPSASKSSLDNPLSSTRTICFYMCKIRPKKEYIRLTNIRLGVFLYCA